MRNSKTIVVYFHRGGLRLRSCISTVFPLDYDKNGNHQPGHRYQANFNEWTNYIRSQVDPNFKPGEILLAEAKGLLIKPNKSVK